MARVANHLFPECASTTTLHSNVSARTDHSWRYSVFGCPRLPRGNMVFSGPNSLRDHRVCVEDKKRWVGEGAIYSPERTSEADYLWRAACCTPHPKPKSLYAGYYGWGIPQFVTSDLHLNVQLKLGEALQQVEDNYTHRFQSPVYPEPPFVTYRHAKKSPRPERENRNENAVRFHRHVAAETPSRLSSNQRLAAVCD